MRWPLVRSTHPNYFTVLTGELLVHVGLAVSGAFGAHNSPIWFYIQQYHGFAILGTAHAIIAVAMLVGFYRNWRVMRAALLLSVTVYLLQTGLLAAGIVRSLVDPLVQQVAFESFFYGLGLILLSAAAYREPLIPGRYANRDEG